MTLVQVFKLRAILAVGGLAGLWLLEWWAPFKAQVDRRWRRWGRNLTLSYANSLVMEAFFGALVVAYVGWLEQRGIGLLHLLGVTGAANAVLAFPVLDVATWYFHKLYHEWPPMWRLHRVHHADLDLDVTSASRFHLFEILLSTAYRMGVATVLGPAFGAIVAFEIVLLASAQFHHSNLKLPDAWDRRLRLLVVTPDMHRVHHSQVKEHTNSNYASVFSFWDRLAGSYRVDGIDQRSLVIGLPEYPRPDDVTLDRLFLMPTGRPCE